MSIIINFATIEATVKKAYGELGSRIEPLTGNERLKVLHDFYHLGREDGFDSRFPTKYYESSEVPNFSLMYKIILYL